MNKLKVVLLFLMVSSCVTTRYFHNVEKGKSLDFSEGKWILNKPETDREIKHLQNIAFNDFEKILGDSLYRIGDLRSKYLIKKKMRYEPSSEEMKDLEAVSNCNFLINYKVEILSDELNSLTVPPPIGTTRKINEVLVEISIYDIKKSELLSRTSIVGKAKCDINEEDSGWNLADTPNVISRNALAKLIKQYRQNKK